MITLTLLWALLCGTPANVAESEKDEAKSWDVQDPGGPYEKLEFDTDEGTWICVDVHPDGTHLVFDLMGDIYTLPIEGGEATPILEGMAWEIQPRYSPDGSRILFTSDRGGGDNIWIANADGSDPQALTKESFRLLNGATWHPSGDYIVARKHFTSRRSLGAGELWMYRVPQGGAGVQLTKKRTEQKDTGEPEFSPDGRYLYWSEDVTTGSIFEYNKDPHGTIYSIRRMDMETGEVRGIITRAGGSVRPQVSPDGKTLAFVRRHGLKTVLSLFDLESGQVTDLWDGLSEDQQETWAIFGVHPGFDWMPDGRSIVISARGKLHRVDVASGEVKNIPFNVRVVRQVSPTLHTVTKVGNPEFPVRVIRWPQKLDDNHVLFQALGHLYVRNTDNVRPQRITRQNTHWESAPSLSRDRKHIVYVTWNDTKGGTVRVMNADGSEDRVLVSRPGHYLSADFSADGRYIVYHRGSGDVYRGYRFAEDPGIYIVPVDGSAAPKFLTRSGASPRFAPGDERIYLRSFDQGKAALVSVNLTGSDRRVHARSQHAVDFVVSPDGRYLAFEELWKPYVVPFPKTAAALDLSPKMSSLPVRELSDVAGTYLRWNPDGQSLSFSLGASFTEKTLEEIQADEEEGPDKAGRPRVFTDLSWIEPSDTPDTDLYFVGARVLPMDDLSVIEDGVVHVRRNRIVKVGTRHSINIPAGAEVIDVSGQTLLPGFVDTHAHTGSSGGGLHSQQSWAMLANLAFGVTATHDPSNNTQMIHASAELREHGSLIAPRIYSTGTILYGAEGNFKAVINTYEDAYAAVKRTQAWGARSVKSYNQPRRDQRQMVLKAARELDVMVMPEGGSTFHHNMTMLIDGHTTIEHALPIAPLYEPELQALSKLGTTYTPTLIVGYGGIWGENYWYQKTDVWKNERLLTFVPESVVAPRSRRRILIPDEEFHHIDLAKVCAEVVHRGGNLTVGAHGQIQGLGVHWEMWMFEQGGLSAHEALRAGTYMGAVALGMHRSFGSIREGLLADLIVIDGDPLTDLRRSEDISHVMINGRLYDAKTMNQLAPTAIKLAEGPVLDSVPLSATQGLCGCHTTH